MSEVSIPTGADAWTSAPYTASPVRAGTHGHAVAAFSWLLQGDKDMAADCIAQLTEPQRDEAMTAAAVLIALLGGLDCGLGVDG